METGASIPEISRPNAKHIPKKRQILRPSPVKTTAPHRSPKKVYLTESKLSQNVVAWMVVEVAQRSTSPLF